MGAMAKPQVTIPLDIPDVRVLGTEISPSGDVIITVESTKNEIRCHKCGKLIRKFHGRDSWVSIRYMPVFGRPTYLRYRPKRYQCQECEGQPTTTEVVDWHAAKSPHAKAFDEHLLFQLVNATIEDVAIKEGVSYDCVLGALERQVNAQVEWGQYTQLGTLGLDEIALKKGHRDFVVIVTARMENGRVAILGVLADRQKDSLVEFLRSIPERLKKSIHTVCSDMYEGYIEAVREELAASQIVIDRFHVTRSYRDGVDEFRKSELRRLKDELSEEEYKTLKGSLWACRKKRDDLRPEERKVLKQLFQYSPKLKLAYDLQEQLSDIFDQPISKTAAKIKIQAWKKRVATSGLKCFEAFLKTLEHWWEEILNYFDQRRNSGFVEGFNNKLKVLKRRCYGIFDLKHLFQRIYLDLEGYRLFAA
jgi:transposase